MPTKQRKLQMVEALRERIHSANAHGAPAPLWVDLGKRPILHTLFTRGLHEIVGDKPSDFAAATLFALAAASHRIQASGLILCAALSRQGQEHGMLHGAGLAHLGIDVTRFVLLTAASEKTMLWAIEEAANCQALSGVVGVLGAHEKLYGFTASRRIKLRQEKSGVPVFLVRREVGEATATTTRWRVAYAPSQGKHAPGATMPLLGTARFHVCLERYAGLPPQQWEIEYDPAHGLRVAAPLSHRPADARPIRAWQVA